MQTVEERFWSYVDKSDGCWLWTGTKQPNGYGRLCAGGKKLLAHRLSYEINVGPIPGGLLVLHTCDVKLCVRPDHLYAGTRSQNSHDAINRGLHIPLRGVKHWNARLTEEQVQEIRTAGTVALAAKKHGIHPEYARQIRRRQRRIHVH
jgi:hypothetical protein